MLALALLVCEWESTTSRNTCRNPKERDRRYPTALIGWGYKPSEVEQLVLAKTDDPEAVEADDPEAVETDNDGTEADGWDADV